ncbi:DUF3237 domain-containing protein [Roseococcus sp. SDR]|uniref:DUF3237 domain-containing protein n=1 Tax=Roseococcus sp. SDR TaxID=2835532 RepID=UPI001BD0F205|nr:DUF3237 domain-containing protein [Roseococcus sp. SDR]MBS7791513.1 DUF3237 domain-containing protein [Roseococcus sp. SDR]MBV1846827.1 DUF3237 domain-containing protein [Roseococcus sp. SDR]
MPLPLVTEYLFSMDLTVGAPQMVGKGADGHDLRVVAVTGGTVSGPALQGEILGGTAADWLRVEADGTAHIDVRLTIKAASGSLVYVQYSGIRTGKPEVLARLAAGETVDPSEYYFRTTMRFQTGAADLAWMNRTLAVGTGQRPPSGPRYDVYAVR